MIIWMLALGAALLAGTIAWGIVAYIGTPRNLRGFYGLKYLIFIILSVIADVALIVASFLL